MQPKITIALALALVIALDICAQTLTDEDIRGQFIKDWERAKAYTIDYLNTVPADKYSFKATDSIRSFAQHMLHLAQSNVNVIAFVTGVPNFIGERSLEESKTAQTRDSVYYYVVASYDLAIEGLKKMNMATLREKVKFYNWEETKFAWLLKAFEHQTHHRAQTTIYIRLLGLHPPQERLF
ncbi:MAG: damage-inducible protein DinB [Bacteroidetes bacterium]|nr:MAG: damage-inducible protein DinB [Bacteroidota bacterium]